MSARPTAARTGRCATRGTYEGAGDWSYWLHSSGVTYVLGGGGAADRRLYFNAAVALRKNGTAWAAADYAAVAAGVNAEFHPRDGMTARTGYRLDRRAFADTSALTHVEHSAFSSVLVNLESRTTLIGEVQLGAKSYAGQLPLDPTVVATSTAATGVMFGQGRGVGRFGGGHVHVAFLCPEDAVGWRIDASGSMNESLARRSSTA